jgi:hypothetical protein
LQVVAPANNVIIPLPATRVTRGGAFFSNDKVSKYFLIKIEQLFSYSIFMCKFALILQQGFYSLAADDFRV